MACREFTGLSVQTRRLAGWLGESTYIIHEWKTRDVGKVKSFPGGAGVGSCDRWDGSS